MFQTLLQILYTLRRTILNKLWLTLHSQNLTLYLTVVFRIQLLHEFHSFILTPFKVSFVDFLYFEESFINDLLFVVKFKKVFYDNALVPVLLEHFNIAPFDIKELLNLLFIGEM
jgi:hypothetical protein